MAQRPDSPPQRPLRVLMLGKGWFPDALGGLDRYFRDLLEHRPQARAVVVGPARGRPPRVAAAAEHSAPLPRRLAAFARAAHRLARDADVVDAHFALYTLAALASPRLRRLPLVAHFQGPWADENVAAGDSSRVRLALRRGLERAVYRRARRIVVLSAAFGRVLVERYGISPWRLRVVPPGVDLERFAPGDRAAARARLELDEGAFTAVCVRRLVPRMGIDVLVEAWARALPDLPARARLLVAGDGPQRAELERLVAERGVAGSVRLLGRVADDELVALYRAADAGVVPTRSFEGFGLVVLEAAACGAPSIVTDAGGLPEAIAGLDESLVVPAGDAEALARRLVAGAAGKLPSRAAAREHAERFDWERVAVRNDAVAAEAIGLASAPRRRLRVVYLDHVAQLSGGEIALLRLLPHLEGVHAHVVLAEDGPFAGALSRAGISVEVLPLAARARKLRRARVTPRRLPLAAIAATAWYVLRLAVRLRRLRPDLVHTNSLKAGVYGSLAARLAGVPIVWHVRDRIEIDYLPAPAVRLVRAMTRRLPAAVIANSHATMATLDPQAEPVIVYSVVPEALIAPRPAERRERPALRVGMVGRIAPWKGQELFLRAFADAFGDGDERCVIVGAAMFGEDAYERSLHALAGELGLDGRVEFRGFRANLWPELGRLDVLVHASLIPEPFGQVVLEGMAAGVPVVAADAGGPAELVEHGVNGLLYPRGDGAALARALRELAGDARHRERLAAEARRTAGAYHPDVVSGLMERLYRRVVEVPSG